MSTKRTGHSEVCLRINTIILIRIQWLDPNFLAGDIPQNVKDYLVGQGVPETQVTIRGAGEETSTNLDTLVCTRRRIASVVICVPLKTAVQ